MHKLIQVIYGVLKSDQLLPLNNEGCEYGRRGLTANITGGRKYQKAAKGRQSLRCISSAQTGQIHPETL
ncbi:MAG: hypothetical protein MJA27_23270 [Pseudanabaenales cyanobacterium]|nr:hypothetical protein [Pseudanabaenales cyanobacterium]